jgi:glycosyltransferase involved in cell wall biosynthesis
MVADNLYRFAFSCCAKVFFQNPDDMKEFNDSGILKHNKGVLINGSGINMEQFEPAPLPESPIFLMIGRIIREKGVLDYLEASRMVKKECPEARMQILGPFDTKMGSLTMDHVRPYIDDGSIEYLGFAKDVRPYIAASSVFVLPSIYREGVPHSILEAMAMGRSIITTDGPGCRETVMQGKNGLLVPQNNPIELAKAMMQMCNNEQLRASMGHNSIEFCRDKFEVGKVNEIILRTMGLVKNNN